MDDPFSLQGKTILITGSTSGIGASLAGACAREGARIVLSGRNADRIKSVHAALQGEGHLKHLADLNVAEQRDALVEALPPLDGLVLNSGVFSGLLPFSFLDDEKLLATLQTNFFSPIALFKRIVAQRKITNGGSVVTISSTSAMLGPTASAAYVASKGALQAASRSIAADLTKRKIRVNNVAFGYVATDLTATTLSKQQIDQTPLGVPTAEEITGSVLFLLSAASSWMTRSTLIVDGGIALKVGLGF